MHSRVSILVLLTKRNHQAMPYGSWTACSAVHLKGRKMRFLHDHCKIDYSAELVFKAGAWCQASSHRTQETLLRCKKSPFPPHTGKAPSDFILSTRQDGSFP